MYAHAKNSREAIEFKLHLTGLEVLSCPNCNTTIDEAAILQEQQTHECRLCSRPAPATSPEYLGRLKLQAVKFETSAKTDERTRAALKRHLRELQQEREVLEKEREMLQVVTAQGIEVVLPSPEEEKRLFELYQKAGQLHGQILAVSQLVTDKRTSEDEADIRLRVMTKAREVLCEEAIHANQLLLERLSTKTQELSKIIGIDSTDVSCSPLGRIQFCKHNTRIGFTSIKNPGERFRVKLAFYLAMMRLGRESGRGCHPSLLLIDQLGPAEMMTDDCLALSRILYQLDTKLSSEVQVICFTARTEFAVASAPIKVYGLQSNRFVF